MGVRESGRIDFDKWSALALNDPEAFEAEREAAVNALIKEVPNERQQRLRCLQWRIEKVRAQASNPVSAYLRLSGMMWDSVRRQQDMLDNLLEVKRGRGLLSYVPGPTNIVPFRPRQD